MEKKFFLNHCPPPLLDTGIPDKHDLIHVFIKEVDTTNGVLYLGGIMSFTTFGTWGRGIR